jgi:hypothetical protein
VLVRRHSANSASGAEQLREAAPRWRALVPLDLQVPHLRALLEVVGGHPHLFLLHDALLVEERFAPICENQRIGCPIVPREVHLLEPRGTVVVVLAIAGGRTRRGRRFPLIFLQLLDIGLQGCDRVGEGLDQLGQIGVGRVSHGRRERRG